MSGAWMLVIIVLYNGSAITTIPFGDRGACMAAAQDIKKEWAFNERHIQLTCVPTFLR